MIKKHFSFFILFLLSAIPLYSQHIKQHLNLDDLIVEALNNNPQLQAFRFQVKEDSLKTLQAGALPDPVVSLNLLNLPVDNFVFDQEPMSGKQFAVRQTFPFFGKLALKEQVSRKNNAVSKANYKELKTQLIRNLKLVYYDLYYVDEAVSTTQKNYRLITEFVKIAEKKYSVGKGLQQDVLKAQVELSRMTEQLITLKQKREQLEANLNKLLNRSVQQALEKTQVPEFSVPSLERQSLKKKALEQRPLLTAWRLRIEQRKAQSALAKKSYLPDFSIFVAYTQRTVLQSGMGGVDFLSGGITFNLPLYFWRKQAKLVQEKQISRARAEAGYREALNRVELALDHSLTELDKNKKLLELYKTGIIPQASQTLQSAMIGYQTDKVDFLTLINNQKTLLNYELQYHRILSAYYKNLAELEYVIGTKIQ